MKTSPKGRWAVVTGASSGIGKATALTLAEDGWNVVVHYATSSQQAESVVAQVQKLGVQSFAVGANFAEPDAGTALVETVWERTGGVHAWAHVAGVDLLTGPNAGLPFEEKLDLALRIDLCGTMMCCRQVGTKMQQTGEGVILTIGWDQAATGMDGDSGQLFAAVKGGIASFSRSLAKSLAPQVRVHCVAPGWIQTAWGHGASQPWQDRVLEETPLKRWGQPQDVADTIAFLVSDRARFLTGQTINVNGGVVTS